MPANFPSSPTLNQQYTYNELTWQYNGRFWQLVTTADYMGATGPVGATGSTGPTPDLGNLYSGLAPNVSTIYDLGTASKQWGNLFLSNVIYLGPTSISITANGAIQLPPGSYVGNLEIGTGAGGSDTYVQFNQGGILGGSANLTFDGTGISSRYFSPTGSTGPTGTIYSRSSGTITVNGNLEVPEYTNIQVINNYLPNYKPTLYMDLVKNKSLDSRFVVSRQIFGATGFNLATYWDGKSTRVVEENQYLQSQTFEDNTAWVLSTNASISVNSTTAPDGTSTAESFVLPAEARNHTFYQSAVTLVPNEIYTTSIFAKANQRRYLQISLLNQNEEFVNFDLQTGTISYQQGQISANIANYGSSWYRCTMTYRVANTNRWPTFSIVANARSIVRETFTPSASDSIYIWGAQYENRVGPTDYQPTTTVRVKNTASKLVYAGAAEPRFDHDPVTSLPRGLLIEDQKTNLINYSQFFANTQYTKTGGSIRSAAMTAPDGTLTFDRFVEDTSTGTHGISESLGSLASQDYTLSIFVKPVNRTWVQLGWNDGSTDRAAYFNLSAGNVGAVAGAATTEIQAIGNSTYRIAVTHSSNVATVFLRGATASGTNSYTGNANNGYYIWGMQLEAGSYMTSYIPNVGNVTLTRPVDVVSTTVTGFRDWYNPTEGTIYVEASSFGNVAYTTANTIVGANAAANIAGNVVIDSAQYLYYVDISNGTNQNGINLRHPGIGYINTYNVEYFAANIGTSNVKNAVIKTAMTYAANNVIHARDGTLSTLDTNVALPDLVDRMTIGNRGNNPTTNGPLNGHIRKIVYYPERLTEDTVRTLTKVNQ